MDQHPSESGIGFKTRPHSLGTVSLELAEGATLRVAPELADPVGSLEVGEHEYVEQLGPWNWTEGVEPLTEFALDVLQVHGIGR